MITLISLAFLDNFPQGEAIHAEFNFENCRDGHCPSAMCGLTNNHSCSFKNEKQTNQIKLSL